LSWLVWKALYPNEVPHFETNCTPRVPHFRLGVPHSRHEQLATLDAPPQEIFFRLSGAGNSMWEIGRLQVAIVKLVEKSLFHADMLDICCDIGDNAIYIAQQTKDLRLMAIDMVILRYVSGKIFHFVLQRFRKPLKSLEKKLRLTTSRLNLTW
jgi:hypothetical protein